MRSLVCTSTSSAPRTCVFFGLYCFFFNDTATTEIYTLSLHDALPIFVSKSRKDSRAWGWRLSGSASYLMRRSEEHTSELQSPPDLVCRLLLEKHNTERPWTEIAPLDEACALHSLGPPLE